jgi:3-methylfumaryl-CoA hydratase
MMASPAVLDLDHLRTWIGRSETQADVITPALVERFGATLNLAAALPAAGAETPLGIHFCLAPAVAPTKELGPDGHPSRGGFLPPVPLPRRMWAGSAQQFLRPLRVGDQVQRTSTIVDLSEKTGRTGLMCFVNVEHVFAVAGSPAIVERHDIVYRAAATAADAAPSPPPPPETGMWQRQVDVTPTLLFRYSAITFNGHRIHYDRRYAVEEEHYPGLVVHGPLQATLLLHMAADLRGSAPKRFSFRSVAPVFDGAALMLHAKEADGRLKLWTAQEGKGAAMRAEAEW